eukprot:gnl/TRDRNA2_/TRDRNA2_81917_c0_seq1.p1 gnl/TRDRNA2_/TRDRNA2_81917_c0~~gnl/TRDRNA2_/TRDRNA2_81917_c0_seq1.p1  ORF type:complete len:649 (-),score=92.11 gnl/TRDRNA2_/TRDRNA2_81917_c0_seq1:109-2055(-)
MMVTTAADQAAGPVAHVQPPPPPQDKFLRHRHQHSKVAFGITSPPADAGLPYDIRGTLRILGPGQCSRDCTSCHHATRNAAILAAQRVVNEVRAEMADELADTMPAVRGGSSPELSKESTTLYHFDDADDGLLWPPPPEVYNKGLETSTLHINDLFWAPPDVATESVPQTPRLPENVPSSQNIAATLQRALVLKTARSVAKAPRRSADVKLQGVAQRFGSDEHDEDGRGVRIVRLLHPPTEVAGEPQAEPFSPPAPPLRADDDSSMWPALHTSADAPKLQRHQSSPPLGGTAPLIPAEEDGRDACGQVGALPSDTRSQAPLLRRGAGSTSFSSLPRTCPLCCCEVKLKNMETFGCGVHSCCINCLAQCSHLQLRAGALPRCFDPNCKTVIDPLVALRILSAEDNELYLGLALWSNPQVEACPRCCALLFKDADPIQPTNARAPTNATCPSCSHAFCMDCRCPSHPGEDCEAALQAEDDSQREAASRQYEDQEADEADTPADDLQRLASLAYENGWKVCPRCRALVEKADSESCDHMTCLRCQHEFCWSCMADRRVIYAHGNHHHRRGCRFYAAYAGPDEYLPHRCPRCAAKGAVCRQADPSHSGEHYNNILDVCARWLRDALRAGNCTFVVPPREGSLNLNHQRSLRV